jgi:YD repeat-containing protein
MDIRRRNPERNRGSVVEANGTLNELNITDGLNAGGTQDCKFGASGTMGYDDLGRLLSDNCGSVWAQTFSYDQYDNLTKSGSSSWTPGYSASNNQYTLAGVTYDASGNLTYDTFHTYTWDEFNKLATIDSSACGTHGQCITYDALGRAVETSNGANYTEIWYTQLGKTAYMTGITLKWRTGMGRVVERCSNPTATITGSTRTGWGTRESVPILPRRSSTTAPSHPTARCMTISARPARTN